MFRSAVLAASKAASARVATRPAIFAPRFTTMQFSSPKPFIPLSLKGVRCYASSGTLGEEEIQGRILDLLKNFDKVKDISKLTSSSEFAKDLGLDSLDTVEVVMAIEEEFGIEIPDKDADAIHSVAQAISYIKSQPDAH